MTGCHWIVPKWNNQSAEVDADEHRSTRQKSLSVMQRLNLLLSHNLNTSFHSSKHSFVHRRADITTDESIHTEPIF